VISEVLTAVNMKILSWGMWSLVDICHNFRGTCSRHLTESFPQNIINFLQDYMASHPRRRSASFLAQVNVAILSEAYLLFTAAIFCSYPQLVPMCDS
jgi:hypothetical protein